MNSAQSPQNIFDFDIIAAAVCQRFHTLPKKGKPLAIEWTTLSGIVQCHKRLNSDVYTCVSCTTGTKCLGQNELSPLGDMVSDSHAEVLARRSFLLYLYSQMEQCLGDKESIFNYSCGVDVKNVKTTSDLKPKIFSLKPDITFHLLISHLPCGDASIINSDQSCKTSEANAEGEQETPESEPTSKKPKLEDPDASQNVNRTGAKLQAGLLIYEAVQSVGSCRVKPGKGDPTLCMSCSDKIAKWQMVGLQGSLLGNFIPVPIRLSSIVIGGGVPFSKESLERAIFTRFVEGIDELKAEGCNSILADYFKPEVVQVSSNFMGFESVSKKQPCPSSIIWHLESLDPRQRRIGGSDEAQIQVIVNGRMQGATKKNFGKVSTMVDTCRKKMFDKFIGLYLDSSNANHYSGNYKLAKELNVEYCKGWNAIRTKIMLGWTTKPENLQECNDN